HNIRIAPQAGHWNWGFGPPPMGLHYARHLFRDGRARGLERLRLMQPEAAGRVWDATQTWGNELPEEDHPTHWIADRTIDWLSRVDRPFFAWVSFPIRTIRSIRRIPGAIGTGRPTCCRYCRRSTPGSSTASRTSTASGPPASG